MPAMLTPRLARAPPFRQCKRLRADLSAPALRRMSGYPLFGELSSAERHASASEHRGGTGVAVCSVPHSVQPARSEFLQTTSTTTTLTRRSIPCLL